MIQNLGAVRDEVVENAVAASLYRISHPVNFVAHCIMRKKWVAHACQ
jgi:hypothetical protein